MLLNAVEQLSTGVNQAACKHHQFRVQDVLEVHHAQREVIASFIPNSGREAVAGRHRGNDVTRVKRPAGRHRRAEERVATGLDRLSQSLGDRIGRSIAFQAAPLPAGTGSSVGDDYGVPDFTGVVESPPPESAIQHHPPADPGPQREHDHIPHLPARTGGEFAECGRVGIVFQHHGQADQLRQSVAHGKVDEPRQIWSLVNDTLLA